jgi:predicted amidohydrolase
MKVTMLQSDICWENKEENLSRLEKQLEKLRGNTDIVVLPEMFSTGFSVDNKELRETSDGETITKLKAYAKKYQLALCGSYIATGEKHPSVLIRDASYNRAFFITPDGEGTFMNKRHLFMGDEANNFKAGNKRTIINYRGWHILLLVCYDLRFPVWSRNYRNEYDLLIYVANWPRGRRDAWDTLLKARAIENISYVCGVNRIGVDQANVAYNGGSKLLSPRGTIMGAAKNDCEEAVTVTLGKTELNIYRRKFPAWRDGDEFTITTN